MVEILSELMESLISRCGVLASLLEVSAYPKPGNVHRLYDMPGTRYEHFLAGGVAIEPYLREAARRGFEASRGVRGWDELEIGRLIREAVEETLRWQRGGNVNLGILLLFAPIAAAAGSTLEESKVEAGRLRSALGRVLRGATPGDAVEVYEAIGRAMGPETLGEAEELSVLDEDSRRRILEEGWSLLEVFKLCSGYDSICYEWVTDFQLTFEVGYPTLRRRLEEVDMNDAIVETYLTLLAHRPDSLIRRKCGLETALEVSEMARGVLEAGGLGTMEGRRLLEEMDEALRRGDGALNPGTTADLTASSIYIMLLEGWRP